MRSMAVGSHRRTPSGVRTSLGSWAVRFAGASVVGTLVLMIAFAAGLDHAEGFSDNWLLTCAGAAILGSAVAAVLTGATAVIGGHDRGRPTLLALVVGLLLAGLMLQQVAEGLGWLGS